jgi:hypothetical protein
VTSGVTTHCAFVDGSEPDASLEPEDEPEVGELSPSPPQLPRNPTATIDPSAESASRRASFDSLRNFIADPFPNRRRSPKYRPFARVRLHDGAKSA